MPDSAGYLINFEAASEAAMAQAELAGASSIGLIMQNAAQAQQACQQMELSSVAVTCAMILKAAASAQ